MSLTGGSRCQHSEFSMTWWRHQMETFSALLALCAENSPVTSEFPSQRPVRRSFDIFFDLHLNKRLSNKKSGRWWFGTPARSWWRHCYDSTGLRLTIDVEYFEYLGLFTEEVGVRLSVHHPSVYPFPETTGYSAPVGSSTSLGVTTVNNLYSKDRYRSDIDPTGNEREKPRRIIHSKQYFKHKHRILCTRG